MKKRKRNLAISRHFWVLAHRWAGLAMAGFLIIVGLTGSLLAFLPELNHMLSPHLFPAIRSAPALGLGELALTAQSLMPQAEVKTVYIDSSGSALIGFKPKNDSITGKPYELGANQLILDSATGRERGRRMVGQLELATVLDDMMPYIYRLHFSLSLGKTGNMALGIVALLWMIDCFVAFYLTLPVSRKKQGTHSGRTMATPTALY